jgi:1-deoxy-D-xylulose-5-phosphate synthase
MRKMGDRDEKLVAVTAAMADGTGLKRFRNMFPKRFFDVGIAEEHAVTFAAALAAGGMRPVFAVYSSFLQRGYDQLLHDVCMQRLPVVLAIDRAGLVGSDGETHQGVFDVSYLCSMPNMTVMAPKNKWELSDMLKFAIAFDGPIALRYPRGEAYAGLQEYRAPIELGVCEEIYTGGKVLLFALGSMVVTAERVHEQLSEQGVETTLVNARFAKPLDEHYLLEKMASYDLIVTLEENVITGGFGEQIETLLVDHGYTGRVMKVAVPDQFVEHGNVEVLKQMLGMDADSITEAIKKQLQDSKGVV